jgi:hypothetical protein
LETTSDEVAERVNEAVNRLNEAVERWNVVAEDIKKWIDQRPHEKEVWTTREVALEFKRRPYTVREWCRHGRMKAQKLPGGRGKQGEWRIAREEIDRYRREGLLPSPPEAVYR